MAGRGAWNNAGVGGTKKYMDPNRPGPYYYTGAGYEPEGRSRDANEYAVHGAVKAYQKALNREGVKCLVDGLYGPATTKAMIEFQKKWEATGDPRASVWGGIGPETSERLLIPELISIHHRSVRHPKMSATICAGVVRKESNWDAGAVGYVDENDVGLAQINAQAHPEWSTDMRLDPAVSYKFVIEYLSNSLEQLNENVRDAIASYNLGIGGARSWIKAGRPSIWKPTSSSAPRNVQEYIDTILKG